MLRFPGFRYLFLYLWALYLPASAAAEDRCTQSSPTISQELPKPFEENGLWGYRNEVGDVVIAPQFQFGGDFSNSGLAAVYRDTEPKGWHYIDTNGASVIQPLPYDNGPDPFVEGLARYKQQDKIGFFNNRGCVVINADFDWAFPFSQGRAVVCNGCSVVQRDHSGEIEGGRRGYIDATGEIVIPLIYQAASGFEGDRARVEIEGESYMIDRSGNRLQ